MDYFSVYGSLIGRAKFRVLGGYVERHHVIPRCMGGDDSADNIVRLTPEEHYVAHQLLVKMYPDHHGLVQAALRMCSGRPGNKLFGWLRRRASENAKGRIGNKNGRFGTRWITNGDLARCIKPGDLIPTGWYLGRVPPKEVLPTIEDHWKLQAEERFKEFQTSGLSMRKYATSIGVSQPSLSRTWKRRGLI